MFPLLTGELLRTKTALFLQPCELEPDPLTYTLEKPPQPPWGPLSKLASHPVPATLASLRLKTPPALELGHWDTAVTPLHFLLPPCRAPGPSHPGLTWEPPCIGASQTETQLLNGPDLFPALRDEVGEPEQSTSSLSGLRSFPGMSKAGLRRGRVCAPQVCDFGKWISLS